MRIICAAGKGEMEDTECLKCAEKRQNICGYDLSLLKAMFNDQEPRPDIHVTDLTGCLLKAYYDKKDPSPRYVQDLLLLSLGIAAHANLETGGGGPLYMSEMPLAADGVVGRTDVYYYSGRIIDYKTTRWIDPEKLPYGTHIDQVNIYAYLLKRMGYKVTSAAIQYIDMSGPTKCRKCKIPYRWTDGKISCQKCGESYKGAHLGAVLLEVPLYSDKEISKIVKEKSGVLRGALETSTPPAPEPSFLCNYCPHTRCEYNGGYSDRSENPSRGVQNTAGDTSDENQGSSSRPVRRRR